MSHAGSDLGDAAQRHLRGVGPPRPPVAEPAIAVVPPAPEIAAGGDRAGMMITAGTDLGDAGHARAFAALGRRAGAIGRGRALDEVAALITDARFAFARLGGDAPRPCPHYHGCGKRRRN